MFSRKIPRKLPMGLLLEQFTHFLQLAGTVAGVFFCEFIHTLNLYITSSKTYYYDQGITPQGQSG